MRSTILTDASQKTDAVIAGYLQAIEAGETPDRQALVSAHPSVQSGLESFFFAYDQMHSEAHVEQTRSDSFAPGQHLGRHCLVRIIGSGTFGTVWLGFDSKLKRPVAIKVPNPERFSSDHQRESFLSEAQIVAQLEHPSIVSIYDVGESDSGNVYLVSRYIAGVNLATQIRRKQHSSTDSARCTAIIAGAIEYAHRQNLIHQDIKPSNILFDTASRRPFLTDFGLAQEPSPDTLGCPIAGTPAYMSPEQASGDVIDHRSDIFSLGVVFYELLTGNKPFAGSDAKDFMRAVREDEPKPLLEYRSDFPPQLQDICLKALRKSRCDRYASAAMMRHELKQFLSTQPDANLEGSVAFDSGAHSSYQPVTQTAPSQPITLANGVRAHRMTRLRWLSLIVLTIVSGFAGGYLVLPDRRPDRSSVPPIQISIEAGDAPQHETSLDRQIAIETIKHGGSVEFSDEDESFEIDDLSNMPVGPVLVEWIMLIESTSVNDDFLATVKDLSSLQGIDLGSTGVTDVGLVHLAHIETLSHVYLPNTRLTDVAGSAIARLSKLEKINFSNTSITDETLKQLVGNTNMTRLDLAGTRIGDAGLAYIATLENLENLDVERCPISDDGLQHLSGLKYLRKLDLNQTSITAKGIALLKDCPLKHIELPLNISQQDVDRFLEAHPGCKTLRD